MKKVKLALTYMTFAALIVMTGCSKEATNNSQEETTQEITDSQETSDSKVASADEMVEPEDVVEEGMTPITADLITEGVYPVEVKSSSSMFRITACELTVKDGKMTAVMTMGGTGYLYLFMGTGEEAVVASEDSYIPFTELESGEHTFEVPVEALDQAINCTAFSKKKEKWYDRVLLFRADSLPQDALVEGVSNSVDSLDLEDGEYTVEATLEGGSGRASIQSPAKLRVDDGKAYLTVVWSSANYDYMIVDDVKYEWDGSEEFSTFEIPVAALDWKNPVIADTTAMSEPHEIEYTIYLDSTTITKAE